MSDKTAGALLQMLFDWWSAPQKIQNVGDFFHCDLTLDRGLGDLKREDFVWWVEQKPPWRELHVLHTVVDHDAGAIVFEGIDSCTELRHRVSWFIEVRDGKIVRLLETSSVIPQS